MRVALSLCIALLALSSCSSAAEVPELLTLTRAQEEAHAPQATRTSSQGSFASVPEQSSPQPRHQTRSGALPEININNLQKTLEPEISSYRTGAKIKSLRALGYDEAFLRKFPWVTEPDLEFLWDLQADSLSFEDNPAQFLEGAREDAQEDSYGLRATQGSSLPQTEGSFASAPEQSRQSRSGALPEEINIDELQKTLKSEGDNYGPEEKKTSLRDLGYNEAFLRKFPWVTAELLEEMWDLGFSAAFVEKYPRNFESVKRSPRPWHEYFS